MAGRDLMPLMFDNFPLYSQDPFSALMPFATGATGPRAGALMRDMPLDVKEVRASKHSVVL